MAKKSNRVLCLILTLLMIVGMIPVANAQYVYNEANIKNPYYSVNYDTLVGAEYQNNKGVYIVDADWDFKLGKEPKTVTFTFRDQTYTETYNPNRHLYQFSDVYVKAKEQGVSLPTCILTEGNYNGHESLSLNSSIILLGAKAGINPNVPNNDPTKVWDLNPARYYSSDIMDENNGGETRLWTPGGLIPDLEYSPGSTNPNTDKIMKIKQNSGTGTFVIDGLSFLGYAACLDATGAGKGAWNVYMQNCVFGDCYSYDTETLRFWNRNADMSITKRLYLSNIYVSDNNRNGFYSGHAQTVYVNGMSYQNSEHVAFFNVQNIPWQGYDFSFENSHFWNEDGKNYDNEIFDFRMDSYSRLGPGSDTDENKFSIKNNTFYNWGGWQDAYELDEEGNPTETVIGIKSTTTSIARIRFGSKNDKFTFEDNLLINTNDFPDDNVPNSPIRLQFTCDKNTNQVTHGWSENSVENTTMLDPNFILGEEQININNNTFIGENYMCSALVYRGAGVLNPANKVEMEGNLYLPGLDATEGQIVTILNEEHASYANQFYDKWVWLDKAMTRKSSALNEADFSCDTEGLEKNGTNWTLPLEYDVMSVDLDIKHNEANSVVIYQADENFVKGEALENFTLDTSGRKSYFVITLFSIDKKTTKDYKLTVNRTGNPAAELLDVTAEPTMSANEREAYGDGGYRFKIHYDNQLFKFAVDATEGATVVVKNATTGVTLSYSNGYYSANVGTSLQEDCHYMIYITDANGHTEKYPLVLYRKLSDHAEITRFTSKDDCTIIDDSENLTWKIEALATASEITFKVRYSEHATPVLTDSIYGVVINPSGTGTLTQDYTVDVSAGESMYNLTITAQDGTTVKVWKIIVSRPKNTECTLISLDDAKLVNGVYVAEVNSKNFFVNAVSSTASTYHIYSEKACLNEIANPYLTLTEAVTNVWIQIHAEDTNYKSVPVQLTINTTADLSKPDNGINYKPMGYNGVVGVTGATEFDGEWIYIDLEDDVTDFFLKVVGLSGHSVHLFADEDCTIAVPLSRTIRLDGGVTLLYLKANKGDDSYSYIVQINSARYSKYTDKQTSWAAPYIEKLNESGLGLMRGDETGAFNGTKNLNRYEMATMMVRLSGANKDLFVNCELIFMDDIVSWAKSYVKTAYKLGLISGYAVEKDGKVVGYTFNGSKQATRAEFIRVLLNALSGDIDAFYEENKADIDADALAVGLKDLDSVPKWAKSAVYTAVALGFLTGDNNGNINSGKVITRNEAATIIARVLYEA